MDHIIPFPLCDFWDKTNWQSLCRKHNIEKGNKDKRLLHERLAANNVEIEAKGIAVGVRLEHLTTCYW